MDKLRTSKQFMLGKKAELLHRISVLKGNTETISKLSKKEINTFITLAEKAQEALKKVSQPKIAITKSESPKEN